MSLPPFVLLNSLYKISLKMECSDVSEGARGQEGNFQPKLLFQAELHSGTSSTTMLQSPNQRRRMVG